MTPKILTTDDIRRILTTLRSYDATYLLNLAETALRFGEALERYAAGPPGEDQVHGAGTAARVALGWPDRALALGHSRRCDDTLPT